MKLLPIVLLSLMFSPIAYAAETSTKVEPVAVKQVQPIASDAAAKPSNPHNILRTYFLAQRPYMQTKAN